MCADHAQLGHHNDVEHQGFLPMIAMPCRHQSVPLLLVAQLHAPAWTYNLRLCACVFAFCMWCFLVHSLCVIASLAK